MKRILTIWLVGATLAVLAMTPATAAPIRTQERLLGALWTYLLETPIPSNPFTGGDPCVDLGKVVVPFAPLGTSTLACTVDPGTKIFVTAITFECSTVEQPPFYGGNPAELRDCANDNLDTYPVHTLTLDGRQVALSRVETDLLHIDLPADNVLGSNETTTLSVGSGWVALIHPLPPGRHTLVINASGPSVPDVHNTTTIIVSPHR